MHLWDAVTGELRCSYLGFDDKDEVSAAFSVAFSGDGSQLAAGGNKLLRLFDVGKPGRECYVIKTHSKKHPGQPGASRSPSQHATLQKAVLALCKQLNPAVPVACGTKFWNPGASP